MLPHQKKFVNGLDSRPGRCYLIVMPLSLNAERALLFMFRQTVPCKTTSEQIDTFQCIAGLTEQEAHAAFAEIEDAGYISREDDD